MDYKKALELAKELGKLGFNLGKKAPCQDKKMMELYYSTTNLKHKERMSLFDVYTKSLHEEAQTK